MKRKIALLMAFVLSASLTACGASGKSTSSAGSGRTKSKNSAETSEPDTNSAAGTGGVTDEWDPSEEKTFQYENGQVLIDTEDVRICAGSLRNEKKDDHMRLRGTVMVENRSGGQICVSGYKNGNSNQSWKSTVNSGKTKETGGLSRNEGWNGKIGDSEDCYQGKYMIRVTDDEKLLAAALFDWYSSETTPFVNIVTDEETIASEWGGIKENYAGPKGNTAAAEGSRENADTNEKASAENTEIFFGFSGRGLDQAVWEAVKNTVARDGIDLELYPLTLEGGNPLSSLLNGQVDMCTGMSNAGLLETQKYLTMIGQDQLAESYARDKEELCPVGYTTYTPLNICSEKFTSLEELKNGGTIVVPWEYSMGGFGTIRSLKVLEAAGLITLKDPSEMPEGYTNYNIEHYIKETLPGIELIVAAAFTTSEIMKAPSEYDALLLPGIDYGNVIFEDPNRNDPEYWEQLWVNKKDVTDPARLDAFEKIVEAYQSETTAQLVENGVGWDVDLIAQYR